MKRLSIRLPSRNQALVDNAENTRQPRGCPITLRPSNKFPVGSWAYCAFARRAGAKAPMVHGGHGHLASDALLWCTAQWLMQAKVCV